ncbi:ArsR family regulatory protein [Haloferax mucosum ATCC BAA-1512]|uniref:ArsR family regulatory protein n=1 Tax=Haloferax mucosum ATCC BAA-1512 TaxID=662479 RepID=M0IG76_9EURY|nr:winged helix-turn-helix domain-containing protein [Haloferax mucosum]ELZ95042.1 ArsR family regulatory protein [Haloferax mucosum ATCC BAA-1512]
MADLLPSDAGDTGNADDDPDDRDPRVVGLDSDEADDLLAAISSSTARSVLASLHESPATPSELATEVETSLQNVQYHLGNLAEADLIDVTDTRYSEKGREMNVYAPADRALVVVAGDDDETEGLKGALTRLIGGIGVLGIGSVVVNRLARPESFVPFGLGSAGESAGGNGGSVDVATNANTSDGSGSDSNVVYEADETTTVADGGDATAADAATTASDAGATTVEETVTEAATRTAETATPAPTATPTPAANTTTIAQQATETAETATQLAGGSGIAESFGSLSPGILFFFGGLTVLIAWIAISVLRD